MQQWPIIPAISGVEDASNARVMLWNGVTPVQAPLSGIPFQPVDADLTAIAGLSKTDGNIIVGNGTTWVAESGNTARTSLGLGTGNTPQFTGLSIGASFSLAPIHVGNQNVENSTDSQVLVSRSITGTGTNPHSFSDSSDLNRAGTVSFNSYDARVTISGANNYGHYVSFQSAPVFNSSGTTTHYYGLFSSLVVNSGTVTNSFGVYIDEGSGAGTIGSQYGLYVEELTKGTTRDYAVWTDGATPSHFGGTVELDRIIYSGSSANILADTSDGSDTKSISVWGGGAVAASRGGGGIFYGNDHATRAGDVRILAGDAAGARIDLEGDVLVTGTVNLSSAGSGQLQFPATQNPSTNANTLDDYEEGTWTPALLLNGSATGITYGANGQVGRYIKIGQLVYITGAIVLTSKGASVGAAIISGLPFTEISSANIFPAVTISFYSGMATIGNPMGQVNNNNTTISLYSGSTTGTASMTDANFTNTTALYFSAVYQASA